MEIDVIATVVSPGAIAYIEAFRGDDIIATLTRGDLLRLRFEGGEIELVARRASWMFTTRFETPTLPDPMPPELVPLLARGATGFRERIVRAGDRLRVRGEVRQVSQESCEPDAIFVSEGAIRLEEVLRFE